MTDYIFVTRHLGKQSSSCQPHHCHKLNVLENSIWWQQTDACLLKENWPELDNTVTCAVFMSTVLIRGTNNFSEKTLESTRTSKNRGQSRKTKQAPVKSVLGVSSHSLTQENEAWQSTQSTLHSCTVCPCRKWFVHIDVLKAGQEFKHYIKP